MSDEESPVALYPGAKAMYDIATQLKNKVEEYSSACKSLDEFIAVTGEGIKRMTVTTVTKPPNARQDRQWSFFIHDKNFDKLGEEIAKQMHARCVEIYEEIQKLKETLI